MNEHASTSPFVDVVCVNNAPINDQQISSRIVDSHSKEQTDQDLPAEV